MHAKGPDSLKSGQRRRINPDLQQGEFALSATFVDKSMDDWSSVPGRIASGREKDLVADHRRAYGHAEDEAETAVPGPALDGAKKLVDDAGELSTVGLCVHFGLGVPDGKPHMQVNPRHKVAPLRPDVGRKLRQGLASNSESPKIEAFEEFLPLPVHTG